MDEVDDWANGVFLALQDLVYVLAREYPKVVPPLTDTWRQDAARYAELEQGAAPDPGQPNEQALLEARKMLYRMGVVTKVFPPDRQVFGTGPES